MTKKRQFLALAVSVCMILTGLSDTGVAQAAPKIKLNKKLLTLSVGKTDTAKSMAATTMLPFTVSTTAPSVTINSIFAPTDTTDKTGTATTTIPDMPSGLIASAESTDDRVQGISIYNQDNVHLVEVFGDFTDIKDVIDTIRYTYCGNDVQMISSEYHADAYFSDTTPGYYSVTLHGLLNGSETTQTYFVGRAGKFDYYSWQNGLILDAASSDSRVKEISVYNNDCDTHLIEVSGDFDNIQDVKDSLTYEFLNKGATITKETYSPESYFSDSTPGYYRLTVKGIIGGKPTVQTFVLFKATSPLDCSFDNKEEYSASLGNYSGWGEHLVVPDRVDKIPVTEISPYTFSNADCLKEVVIPNGVILIFYGVFDNCKNLKKVTLPSGLREILDGVFSGCKSLETLNIPDSITYIGDDVFYNTPWLKDKKKTATDGLVILGGFLVDGTAAKGDVVVPSGVTVIKNYAFYNCEALTSILLPDTLREIGLLTFRGCVGLEEITIPDSVTLVDHEAFSHCTSLKKVTLSKNMKEISSGTFEKCKSLEEVTIPEGVTDIDYEAFDGCDALTDISLPDSLEVISDCAFSGCKNLRQIIIPKNVTWISDYAFYGCKNLTSVTLPDRLTTIEEGVFDNCTSLTAITIPESVTTIRANAFRGTAWLTKQRESSDDGLVIVNNILVDAKTAKGDITIPDGTLKIVARAFDSCDALIGVTIPQSVTEIGGGAFAHCTNLTKVTLPENITRVKSYTFEDCTSLTSVTIPDGVTYIGWQAFYECKNLKNIALPKSLLYIDSFAFESCENLTEVTIPDKTEDIDMEAFGYCSNLKKVTLPQSIDYLESDVFEKCSDDLVLWGYKDSKAERYAKKHKLKFKEIEV